jgi:hypothetical protein
MVIMVNPVRAPACLSPRGLPGRVLFGADLRNKKLPEQSDGFDITGPSMPKYYFDVISNDSLQRDEVGIDFPSADEVRSHAAKILTGLAHDEIADQAGMRITVSVRDDTDFPVFTAELVFETKWND